MLNEFVYCPRLFYIEFVQGEFEHSADTVEGQSVHRRVDKESGQLPTVEKNSGSSAEAIADEEIRAQSVMLSSEKYGIIAKMDLVEGTGRMVSPVDYKKGKKPEFSEGAWPTDKVQICSQALILRENGYDCTEGFVYYAGSKERVPIPISEELVEWTVRKVEECRIVAASGICPAPLDDSPKCQKCSLVGICLPDETNLLSQIDESPEKKKDIRRLYPARDDAIPVYIQEQGSMVTKRGEEILIKMGGSTIGSAKLIEMSQLALFGNVQLTTPAIKELCDRNIPICYFSTGGWFSGITHGMGHKNVELRIRQYATASDPAKALALAKKVTEGKIRNCRTLLRRNSQKASPSAMNELAKLAKCVADAKSAEELLGIEGSASRVYFMHFPDMLKHPDSEIDFDFESRNRRPPKDPVNSLLSYVYAVLAKDVTVSLLSVGFDPYLGFYHRPRYGRPSLALDMMEEFRPIIADSTVITLINNGEVCAKDFVRRGNAVSIAPAAKKSLLKAYERRMDDLVTHPTFGYRISYRRVLEVQARLLARYLLGEIEEYPMFCTR
ncbi:MAG: CRISPR-associated endonuclease Cas4/Cas1 [Thermoplasmata archaeon HGW-Thermoplasmata-1]|nr:MAG: CRISPR-associated endonuclease Cas4/Cas1 [Thermoplasmata archaeon HGW-Thermoplasmata-1]